MSAPKKPGRRPKDKIYHGNIHPSDPGFLGVADSLISHLSVDPTWGDDMAMIFGPLITHRTDDHFRKFAGLLLALAVENAPLPVLSELFDRILAMRKNAGAVASGYYPRTVGALIAWKDFMDENGFSPTKPKLKKHIIDRPDKYHNMPPAGDGKGWTRLWKDAGLGDLEG